MTIYYQNATHSDSEPLHHNTLPTTPKGEFAFIPPSVGDSRSPCPALNALANHGYISRNGERIPFFTLLRAVKHVYNLTLPLALLLTTFGYLTSGRLSFLAPPHPHPHPHPLFSPKSHSHRTSPDSDAQPTTTLLMSLWHELSIPVPTWTLDLSSLCARGALKITHDASLVHADSSPSSPAAAPSSPDPLLLAELLSLARPHPSSFSESTGTPTSTVYKASDGLTLADLGRLHAAREAALPPGRVLNRLHKQVALGECGLAWCVMRAGSGRGSKEGGGAADSDSEGAIPIATLVQWFGEERLPEGWWGGVGAGAGRPERAIGIREAGRRAREVGMFRGVGV